MTPSEPPVVLFDGVCNLCSGTVQFILARDARARFRFASLQSEAGRQRVEGHPHAQGLDSIVLLDEGKLYTRSAAALRIAGRLDGLWPLMQIFLLVPRPIRDSVYNWVARHRYRWFGKLEACWLPTPDLRARFLDSGPT